MIINFFNELLFIIQNIFEVLPRDIERSTQDTYIQAFFITGFFYLISRWFKAYALRLILFIIGAIFVIAVLKSPSFLNRFDFYVGLGMLLPHIEIVEFTYLLLREKTLYSYGKLQELILVIISPFVWLYGVGRNVVNYFKAKQQDKTYTKNKSDYEEKSRQYKQERQSNQQKQHTKREAPKQEKQKAQQWWESSDNHKVLRVSKTATKAEIKKAYRKLALLYHPDHTLTKKEEHQIIFVKINNAYEALK